MSEREFWEALVEARRAYSTGGIEGAGSWIKRMFDAAESSEMQGRIALGLHPLCGEQTTAPYGAQEKVVSCVKERGHEKAHQAFFPDTVWTTPW